jgi:hypothetical protein
MFVGSIVKRRGLSDILATTNSLAQVMPRPHNPAKAVVKCLRQEVNALETELQVCRAAGLLAY